MRITIVMGFFLPVPPLRGGATEKIWYRFAQEFAAAGHNVTIVSRRWPGLSNRETSNGITQLRVTGCNHTRLLPINLLLDLWWSLRVLRHLQPADVLVSNNVTLPMFARRLRPQAGRVAVVLGRMPKGQTRWYGDVDRVLPTSNAVFRQVMKENPSLESRCRVILNPADATLHAKMNVKPRTGAPLTIGYVGRINPEKGLETLIDAAGLLHRQSEVPAWRLIIVGPHDVIGGGGGKAYRDALEGLARSALPSDRFEFAGPIFDATELARRYGEMDVFCYPTRAERGEGLSVAPIEAMAAGAVPVLSMLPCFDDLIRPGENGLLFNHRATNPAAELATCLGEVLQDRALRAKLAQSAQHTALRFDYSVVARQMLADFHELAGSDCGLAR
jgi:glycosyltransferase involved in cell wall biosynthesis